MSWILVIQILILWFALIWGITVLLDSKDKSGTIFDINTIDHDAAARFKANMEKIQKAARDVGE